MARACGCDLRAVLAGVIICWAAVEGVAVAQQGAEVTEELGSSYRLARRTTGQGSIIETLLFDGRPIVTEIVVPAPAAGTTGLVARTSASNANPPSGGAAGVPLDIGPGFSGTLLTGEVIDNYLVLHRARTNEPVMHEIFHAGQRAGSITEVAPLTPGARSAGRNSFAFESADDRFVVHLTQPDGTTIRATTEHGHFSSQVVERSAALAGPQRAGAAGAVPSERPLEAVRPSIGRSPEPQRLARPQEAAGSVVVEEPAPPVIRTLPETVPLHRPFPLSRIRPVIGATAVHTASPSPAGNLHRNAPEPLTVAPTTRPKPTAAPGDAPPPVAATAPRPVAPASATTGARAKPVVTSVNAPPPPASPAARSVAPAPSCYYALGTPVWDSSRGMWVSSQVKVCY